MLEFHRKNFLQRVEFYKTLAIKIVFCIIGNVVIVFIVLVLKVSANLTNL